MVSIALSPFLGDDNMPPEGIVLTAVLPGGCQLACPYCIVAMRGERRSESPVTPMCLAALSEALGRRGALAAAAVVGDEPLQAHAWPYAEALLGTVARQGLPTGIITNGLELAGFLPRLRTLAPTRILVSLDGVGARHDRLRRTPGAFARIDHGIRQAIAEPDMCGRLAIASILMPGNARDVAQVLDYAAEVGVGRVFVSPLMVFPADGPFRVHPKVLSEGGRDVADLCRLAAEKGIELCLSDEFAALGAVWSGPAAAGRVRAPAGKPRLVRVDADGRIATYEQIRTGTRPALAMPDNPALAGQVASQIVHLTGREAQIAA